MSRPPVLRDRILRLLATFQHVSAAQVARALDVDPATAAQTLSQMKREGRIVGRPITATRTVYGLKVAA